jgi:transcriptional regulator with AAA-type ATPase domain/tetratricopeptide (TPR) repeat protein
MRVRAPRSLLLEHPALPIPFATSPDAGEIASIAALDHRDRVRVAVQLLAATALLAEFELWPGRWALKRASVERTGDGLQVRLPALPLPLSRIWSRLGGGDPATLKTRAAIVEAVEARSGLEGLAKLDRSAEPGFFPDRVLIALVDELGTPLDRPTARSLWMWRWSLPRLPDPGDRSLLSVPDEGVARRVGAALWAAAARQGRPATLELSGYGHRPVVVARHGGDPGVRIRAGTFGDDGLTALVDGLEGRGEAEIAVGRFPEGWNPSSAPVYDPDRLTAHLALVGLTQARLRTRFEHELATFDPFSPVHRQGLTRSARWLFAPPPERHTRESSELERVAGLAREGVPVDRALSLADATTDDLRTAVEAGAVVIRGDRVVLPQPALMTVDPRHGDVAAIFGEEDPRRHLHEALASGDPGKLISWARRRLNDLDAEAVRRLLSTVENGALGTGVQVLLVEACLFLADVHGARRALDGLPNEVARPWSAWLRVMDRSPEQEIDLPRPTDIRYAARACAEIALVRIRRAKERGAVNAEEASSVVREAVTHLEGANRRWVEIRLAARVESDRLEDRRWRRSVVDGHPELAGLVLFERSMTAVSEKRFVLARRLFRRLMTFERAPGRRAFLQLNLGYLEAERGRLEEAEALTAGAHRLFLAAGFRRRYWDALYNLAVADIDQLRVVRAAERLDALAEVGPSLYLDVERARLALAVGDLEGFRSRLLALPGISELTRGAPREALSFLHGAAALLDRSPALAEKLLADGGGEGSAWLDLSRALAGTGALAGADGGDRWGVGRAARMVRSLSNGGGGSEIRMPADADLTPADALAVALCDRLGPRSGFPDGRLRARSAATLARSGLTGWAAALRWRSRDVDGLLSQVSKLVRDLAAGRSGSTGLDEILRAIDVDGLAVRSPSDHRELFRSGEGRPGLVFERGHIEIVVLGERSPGGSAWDLLVDLFDLLIPVDAACESDRPASDVRIDGVSEAARRLRDEVRRAATPAFPVFIHGETGSGKEVVAREIHRLSGRTGDLVSVNIAAVPANLLEAELFGSVKGAFTGADRSRRGLVAAAEGGTLFLDEVGDLDSALQVKLLRFLESGEVRAVGADHTRRLDVRVICATHRNLERRVREGRFREDLYYRIVVAKVEVPPLRARIEDIPVLRSIFEREVSLRHNLSVPSWTAAAQRSLANHRWPGNIRELKHTVKVAMARSGGAAVRPEHLRLVDAEPVVRGTWEGALADFKRRLLSDVLGRHCGNRSAAARELGVSRQALLYQVKKLGLDEL